MNNEISNQLQKEKDSEKLNKHIISGIYKTMRSEGLISQQTLLCLLDRLWRDSKCR